MTEIPSFTAKSRNDFRRWLEKNHSKYNKVAIVLNKKYTGIPSPSHRELMEEAICFGWIDTTIKSLDENQYIRHFAKRNSKSKWSSNTLSYAEQLIKQKKMTPIGLKFYLEGKSRPILGADIPKNPDMPQELKKTLARYKKAWKNFEKFSPSVKRMMYRWLLSAKTAETRAKRVKLIVERAKIGRKDIFSSNI